MQNYELLSVCEWLGLGNCSPAGSLRYDKLVRSSVASSKGGFLNGGRISEGVEIVDDAERRVRVVVTLVTYYNTLAVEFCSDRIAALTLSCSSWNTSMTSSPFTCLLVTCPEMKPSFASGNQQRAPST